MRIIVMSDSHGDKRALEKIFERTCDTGDIFVHLGDGEKELMEVMLLYPKLDIRHVAGNCDYSSDAPGSLVITAEGVRMFAVHGNRLSVEYSTEWLLDEVCRINCKVALFGHTHRRYQGYERGVYILNPGSCSRPRGGEKPSYGYVDITPAGIVTNVVDL